MSFPSSLEDPSHNTGGIPHPDCENGSDQGVYGGGADDEGQLDPQVSKKCIEIAQEFRIGRRTKVSALLEIQKTIPRESDSDEHFHVAFGSYSKMLDGFQRYRESAADRSRQSGFDPGREGTLDPPEPGDAHKEPVGAPKRSRSVQSEDESDHPSKRKVDLSKLPWVEADSQGSSTVSESLRLTQSALQNFARDLKYTKSSVINSFKCPQFPDSEWTNLLAGRSIDLDHVLSGLFSVSQDDKKTEHIGELEIAVGPSVPAKVVRTHGEWNLAWDPTVEATIYALPHRESELKRYGKYIQQLFSALPADAHHRVISFDRAVRVRVAQRRDISLTDFGEFIDLQMHWIQTASSTSGRSNQGRRGDQPGASK